ncbi:hypothetical protein ACFX12_028157 [Malus domestica]
MEQLLLASLQQHSPASKFSSQIMRPNWNLCFDKIGVDAKKANKPTVDAAAAWRCCRAAIPESEDVQKEEESHGVSKAFSFVKVGRHTYLGNVGMFRLGWRRSLMEEILNYGIFFLLRCSLRHKFSYDQARPQQLPSLACSVSSLAAHPQFTLLCYW